VEEDTTTKKKDVNEIVRLAMLKPENLEIFIRHFLFDTAEPCGQDCADIIERSVGRSKEQIMSDEFTDQFFHLFDEIFTDAEIKHLLASFKTEPMIKFHKHSADLMGHIMRKIHLAVLIQQSPMKDSVFLEKLK